jgi:hypothetical protein
LTADVGQLLRDYDVALALIFGRQPFEMPHPAPDAMLHRVGAGFQPFQTGE